MTNSTEWLRIVVRTRWTKAVARNDVAFKFWATLHAKRLALARARLGVGRLSQLAQPLKPRAGARSPNVKTRL
jgi:hypothetical protein